MGPRILSAGFPVDPFNRGSAAFDERTTRPRLESAEALRSRRAGLSEKPWPPRPDRVRARCFPQNSQSMPPCPESMTSDPSSSPVRNDRNAATAASIVGKKCDGSIVRVSSYRSILARTGSFNFGEYQGDPLGVESLVQVLEHVGSRRIYVSDGLGGNHNPPRLRFTRGQRSDLLAECSSIREEERCIKSEHHQTVDVLRLRVEPHVVIAGNSVDSSERRAVGPPGSAEDVQDGKSHSYCDTREYTEDRDTRRMPQSTRRIRFGARPRASSFPPGRRANRPPP